jgi:hypothetical protein
VKAKARKIKYSLKKNVSHIVLMIATFFNPLGFDALFALVMKWTGSYWITDVIFYCLSAFFFGVYFLLRRKDRQNRLDESSNI